MKRMKYFSQHMHMHSCYQPGASMEGHIYHAANLGMRYIWFTDHDIRMGKKYFEVTGFDFEKPSLWTEENGREEGFRPDEDFSGHLEAVLTKQTSFTGTQCMLLTAKAGDQRWQGGAVSFWASGKRHSTSVMAGLKLHLGLMSPDWSNCVVLLDVQMSQRPPEHTCAHLLYLLAKDTVFTKEERQALLNGKPHTALFNISPQKGWESYTLDITKDVQSEQAQQMGVGGLDNAFDTLRIFVYAKDKDATVYVDDFKIDVDKRWEAVRQVQKKVAQEKGALYGVTPFVGTEITEAGQHKNCFSTHVPIIAYDARDCRVTHEEAAAWVRKHNGVFALNHPFEKYKRQQLTQEEKENCIVQEAHNYIENQGWGATLMEVGFPEGRCNFSLQAHLKLWDQLTSAGVFLTGYGSSDNHSNRSGWYSGNNFATWLGVPEEEPEPVSEAAFLQSMRSGRCYTGDPVAIKGEVRFETASGAPMGTVIQGAENCETIFTCREAKAGWIVKWMCNGQPVKQQTVDADGAFRSSYTMRSQAPITFVRVEVYDADGRCILLTNPIHVVKTDAAGLQIPPERLY